jgi:hypothetical protein
MDKLKRSFILIFSLGMFIVVIAWQDGDYKKNLLILKDQNGTFREIKNERDWYRRRAQILDSIQLVMGPLPDVSHKVPPDVKIDAEKYIDGIRRLKISFATEMNDRVPAYLFIPVTGKGAVPVRLSVLERKSLQVWVAVLI